MYLSELATTFYNRKNTLFMEQHITIKYQPDEGVLFDGSVEEFIEKVFNFDLDGAFSICEIIRGNSSMDEVFPIYNRPMIITVI